MGSEKKENGTNVDGYIHTINGFLENDHLEGAELEAAIDMVGHFRQIPEEDFETPELKSRLDTAINSFDNWVFAHK